MEEFITYLGSKIEEGKAETAALLADGRKDDADFAKVRTNIYDVCRTLSLALIRFRTEWGAALEKAKQHGNVSGIAVEETKLAALEDIIVRFQEAAEA